MRSLAITFLFSAMSFCCLAQTPFTEQMLRDISANFVTNPEKVVKEHLAPDFVMYGNEGQIINYEQTKDIILSLKHTRFDDSEVKIQLFGTIAIATGVKVHEASYKEQSGKLHERYTSIYQFKGGKWLWTSVHYTTIVPKAADDEVAIKKVLDEQVAAMYAGDVAAIQKFYKDDPKAFHIMSGTTGEFMWRDNENIKSSLKTAKPRNATPVRSNYNIKIVGNMAMAHYDQNNTSNDGKVRTEHNLHILERVNNEWKIIGSSIHPNNLANEEKPEEVVKQWITEYNKDGKSFFEKNCSDDFIASNTGINGGKFFGREFIVNRARKENETNDVETTNMKSFQSGDLAVVVGNLIWHHKQADGSDKPDNTVSTFIMQKKNGKWWYAGHLISPLKE